MSRAGMEAAFLATTYRVETPESTFDLRIGVVSAGFDEFLRRQSVSLGKPAAAGPARTAIGWGIVTAYNPGERLSDHQNEIRQRRLHERLTALAGACFAARNLADADADWPVEPSYLVLPVDEQLLAALGREFCQLAVVYGETGLAPRLLWL
ncbi:DUF3293 domain-containing protein [Candidatus Accumulibacter sp. ACC007]|uniref:DUF3293 domain-containing protein n=1 Tax=Candidatus Accumulibacter sp. ACC007 TaxID=2823333 RepID=UPI0025B84F08|nr:DUF3293 domain-containing protein [Candidatus Accumulibacter sp. ACC007]